ncbi:DUF4127 family protein [Vibrio crassostreae]|uniref:DUF4127 family protein n=1 Tax=Vibrio crassostreae TaxID=246167 RepID=UPI002FE40DC7
MKTLFIPLDERPCNYVYPQNIAQTADIELVTPEMALLSHKKTPANTANLWQFVFDNLDGVDNVILSVDMMLYGGLIPSRLHCLDSAALEEFEASVRKVKQVNPNAKIYTYNCIMRCPSYSSSDEEPDYYDDYGAEIFRRKYLQDKQARESLNEEEAQKLESLVDAVPQNVLDDFESRRTFNAKANLLVAKLVKEKVIDFLVIPQDDSSPFGYTAIDQKSVINYIEQESLSFDIAIYPGADEVGVTLLSRAYNEHQGYKPKVFPFYASTLGPQITPLYEDRPMNESVKAHIRAAGAVWADNSSDADYILAINSPGKFMQEAAMQSKKDLTYSSGRNLLDFAQRIEEYVSAGKKVMVADSAFANGGDIELIRFLDKLNVLGKLTSYKGWNTNCNTLGTTLGAGMIADLTNPITMQNISFHILEDVCYQAVVRPQLLERYFSDAAFGHTTYPAEQLDEAMATAKSELLNTYRLLTANSLPQQLDIDVFSPWQRTFEIGLNINGVG